MLSINGCWAKGVGRGDVCVLWESNRRAGHLYTEVWRLMAPL